MDVTAAKAAFLEVRHRPLPDVSDPDVQMAILLGNEYTEIIPHLFLAGDYNPQKVLYLNGNVESTSPRFGFVVRCSEKPSKCVETNGVPLFAFGPREDSEGRMCVGTHCFDLKAKNDLLKLKDCCIEIKAKLEQQCNVLVHCQQGVDRSATVVAAFCMSYFDISTTDARESLKRLRPACAEQQPLYEDLLRTNEGRIRQFFGSLPPSTTDEAKAMKAPAPASPSRARPQEIDTDFVNAPRLSTVEAAHVRELVETGAEPLQPAHAATTDEDVSLFCRDPTVKQLSALVLGILFLAVITTHTCWSKTELLVCYGAALGVVYICSEHFKSSCEMLHLGFTFLEAIAWMCPTLLFFGLLFRVDYADQVGLSLIRWLAVLLYTLLTVLVEESMKYVVLRRILFKDSVVDSGALFMHSLVSGIGFAVADSLTLLFVTHDCEKGDTQLTQNPLVHVPLRCVTAIIIGMHLGYRKFLGRAYYFLTIIFMPSLLHTVYGMALQYRHFFGIGAWDVPWLKTFFVLQACAVIVAAAWYARFAWNRLDNVCIVDVHRLMAAGKVTKPQCCFAECACFFFLLPTSDRMVQEVREEAISLEMQAELERAQREGEEDARSAARLASFHATSTRSFTSRLLAEVHPPPPGCQTYELECVSCARPIRAHIAFPSQCPFCKADAPAPPHGEVSRTAAASGIGF